MGGLCWLGTFGGLLVSLEERTDPLSCLQVLFTADLKAFADYGLVTPNPSPKKQDASIYPAAPVHSARKRSAKQVKTQDALKLGEGLRTDDDSPAEASSLADRVKKRRRVSQAPR
jgi:hypothetical protein